MIVRLLKSIFQLFDIKILRVIFITALMSSVLIIILGIGLFYLLAQVPFGSIPWIGSWLTSTSMGDWVLSSSIFAFLVICCLFVFPYVLLAVSAFFQEKIIQLTEDRYYPNLPRPLRRRAKDEIFQQLKFFAMVLGVNIVFSPLYLILMFTGFGAIILSSLINGYLIGIEYYNMVGLRRLTESQHNDSVRLYRVVIHLHGVLIYLLMLIPFVNLLIPVFACLFITHLFHDHHAENSYMTSAQD